MKNLKTAADVRAALVRTLTNLLNEEFYSFQSEHVNAGSYSRDSGRLDRFVRCQAAASEGSDGSTHAEHIDDFREWADLVYIEIERAAFGLDQCDAEGEALDAEITSAREALDADIDKCEEWHAKNGTLDTQIG